MSYKSSIGTGDNLHHSDHERKLSTSSSASDYSYDSYDSDAKSEASTRRGTTPSKGGADRRRVAIMQMPSLRSRRGQTGLALVAPPDAAPTNYTPPTANITSDQDTNLHQRDITTTTTDTHDGDQNSSRRSRSPRLTTSHIPLTPSPMFSPVTPEIGQPKEIHTPVAGPIVLNLGSHLRNARTDSPLQDPSLLGTPISSYLHYQPGLHSVAGPLPPPPRANFNIDIHNSPPPRPPRLDSRTPTRSKRDLDAVKQSLQLPPSVTAILASKSSNLSTKSCKEDPISDLSDVNSKSKSDIKPLKEVPLTDLINADSNSDIKPSSKPYKDIPFTDLSDVDSKLDIKPSSEHRREGAFSPLDGIPAESPKIAPESTTLDTENKGVTVDTADVTVIEPPSNRIATEINHHKFSQWLKSNPEHSQPLGNKRKDGSVGSVDESHFYKQRLRESPEPSDSGGGSDAPSPPPKSFRNSLTVNLKRLSLPRTASLSSKSARSRRWSGGNATHHSSRTPSPSIHRVSPPPLVPRIKSTNPAALFCHEVHSQRTTSERCLIYATKINELHLYDCGLSEWVVNMKSRGPNTQHQGVASAPQPRHTSRSSVISEASFPSRPDASTATDLSQDTYGDITPTSVSLTLPYPSLAMNPPRTNPSRSNSSIGPSLSIRSLTPPSSISLKSGGFFASLGRKTSLSKKEKPTNILISSSSPGSLVTPSTISGRLLSISSKHTSSQSINTMNISRPFNISNPPSVPGGPRAPPNRNQRSHTFTPSFPPNSPNVNSDIGRRPSMFDLSLDSVIDIRASPEFNQQVDKLASLLPHANRDVLAGYLRRAGKDMLAIGQYLEDEKNGTIQLCD